MNVTVKTLLSLLAIVLVLLGVVSYLYSLATLKNLERRINTVVSVQEAKLTPTATPVLTATPSAVLSPKAGPTTSKSLYVPPTIRITFVPTRTPLK